MKRLTLILFPYYSNLDSLFSNNFQNTKQTNRTGLFYRYRYKKNSLKLGAYARNVQIINQELDGTPLTDDLNFSGCTTSNFLQT